MEPDDVDGLLERASLLSDIMREHQAAVARVGVQRREVIRLLRAKGVLYRVIAAACGVTDQALYADLRKHPQ
jgi:hypothetical protein